MAAVAGSYILSAGQLSAQVSSPGVVPATILAVQGVIDDLVVTEVLSNDIHVACLLAGWGSPRDGQPPSRIEVNISWETNGPARLEPAGSLIGLVKVSPQDSITGHLESGAWNYSSSLMDATGFAASREASNISVINDPTALVNHAVTDRDDDVMHVPDASLLPPQGTPMKITLRGPPANKL